MKRFLPLLMITILMTTALATENKSKKVEDGLLVRSALVAEPSQMVSNWQLARLNEAHHAWQKAYDAVKTADDVKSYQQSRVDYFRRQLGTMWPKTPLNARVVGRLQKEGFRVEKILFESIPGFYVTGTLYLPRLENYKPPYPVILGLCGHNEEGKAASRQILTSVLAARRGLASLVIDPIDQGERLQHLKQDGKPYLTSVAAHNLLGATSILLGRNTATFEVWDMIRALDYLQTRPDVKPDRIGAAGCSGGGTQTSYIMALDDRILAAAPSCYTCSLFGKLGLTLSPQDAEQNIFGQLTNGIDHADYSIMRAPKPTLLCTATRDFFSIDDAWYSYRLANRIYTRLGAPEKMAILEADDPHGYWPPHRLATIQFMLRWLAGRDECVQEPKDMPVVTEEDIRVLPQPGILSIKGARTTYDLNRDLEAELRIKRKKCWDSITPEQARDLLRKRAGIRPLNLLPNPQSCLIDGGKSELVLQSENGIYLPVRLRLNNEHKEMTLYIDDQGIAGINACNAFEEKNRSIAVLELRGWGETQSQGKTYFMYKYFGKDGTQFYMDYLMGRSLVGLRTEDLLKAARYFTEQRGMKIHLVADGLARTIALHAAITEPQLFESLEIRNPTTMNNWGALIDESPCPVPLADCIHGVLLDYDLDNLLQYVNKIGLSANGKQ